MARRRFAFAFAAIQPPANSAPVGRRELAALRTYEILTPGRPIRNRKLTRLRAKQRPRKEAIMLDVAFVALGLAVLGLIGFYALALREL